MFFYLTVEMPFLPTCKKIRVPTDEAPHRLLCGFSSEGREGGGRGGGRRREGDGGGFRGGRGGFSAKRKMYDDDNEEEENDENGQDKSFKKRKFNQDTPTLKKKMVEEEEEDDEEEQEDSDSPAPVKPLLCNASGVLVNPPNVQAMSSRESQRQQQMTLQVDAATPPLRRDATAYAENRHAAVMQAAAYNALQPTHATMSVLYPSASEGVNKSAATVSGTEGSHPGWPAQNSRSPIHQQQHLPVPVTPGRIPYIGSPMRSPNVSVSSADLQALVGEAQHEYGYQGGSSIRSVATLGSGEVPLTPRSRGRPRGTRSHSSLSSSASSLTSLQNPPINDEAQETHERSHSPLSCSASSLTSLQNPPSDDEAQETHEEMHHSIDDRVEEFQTIRGRPLLTTNGFRFTIQRRLLDESFSVLCADRYRKSCRARIIIRNGVVVRIHNGSHTHLPTPGRVTAAKVKSNIRKSAGITNAATCVIVNVENVVQAPTDENALATRPLTLEEQAHMPKTSSLKRAVQRRRQVARREPPLPQDGDFVFEVPSRYSEFDDGSLFIHSDVGSQ